MSFADSNRTGLKFIEESAWGTTPTGPNMSKLPFTSESLKSDITTVTSETIRDDRNVQDVTKVGGGASGDIGFELRYSDWDSFIEGALQNSFVETVISTTIASAHFSGAHIQADTAILSTLVSGQFIRVTNASATANNGDYRITKVSSIGGGGHRAFLADASSGSTSSFSSDVFSATTKMYGKMARNGVAGKSYTIEKEFTDVASALHTYAGMRVGTMTLNFESRTILTGSFAFIGKSQAVGSVTVASATTDATTNPVMNASGNVGRIWEGGEAVTGISFKSVTIELNNNPREQDKVGSDALAGVATGRCEVTGSLSAYFENNTVMNKFVNGTATNLRFQVDDSNSRSVIVGIPNARLTEGTATAGGGNADVMQDYGWAAFIDDTGAYAIQIDILDN